MIIRTLHKLGIPSDVFYLASLGSIVGSVGVWARRSERDKANAERLGIFIGLWAPTFMLLANGLQMLETETGLQSPTLKKVDNNVAHVADGVRSKVESAVG